MLEIANIVFAILFTIEAVLKLIGLGCQYWLSRWNDFDFTLVLLSWIGMLFDLGSLASLFRIFRVARMVRLIRNSPGLLNLFKTLIFSFPAIINVGTICILLMFILSCIAMNLFANVKHGEYITENANFMTFFMSFNTLWRVATGESYNGLMREAMIGEPYCSLSSGGLVNPKETNCGSPVASVFFFVMTFLSINYVLLNLLIAIILDNFSDTQALSESVVTRHAWFGRCMHAVWCAYRVAVKTATFNQPQHS